MTEIAPDFLVRITLYPTSSGGRQAPIVTGSFGCPCKFHPDDFSAWDCRILNIEGRFSPGETRVVGIAFGVSEIAPMFQLVEKFFLWESRIIGEASSRL